MGGRPASISSDVMGGPKDPVCSGVPYRTNGL